MQRQGFRVRERAGMKRNNAPKNDSNQRGLCSKLLITRHVWGNFQKVAQAINEHPQNDLGKVEKKQQRQT